MLVAGYFRSGPAHSYHITCSLKAWKAYEAMKSDRALRDEFLHKLFLLCSQECILVSAWRYPSGDWLSGCGNGGVCGDDVSGMNRWFI